MLGAMGVWLCEGTRVQAKSATVCEFPRSGEKTEAEKLRLRFFKTGETHHVARWIPSVEWQVGRTELGRVDAEMPLLVGRVRHIDESRSRDGMTHGHSFSSSYSLYQMYSS